MENIRCCSSGEKALGQPGQTVPSDGLAPPSKPPSTKIQSDFTTHVSLIPSRQRRFLNRLSIICAGSALICDGYHNSLMSAVNLVFKLEYPREYNSRYTTAVSNAMTVGQILGMLTFGLICDLISRRRAIVFTTLFMVVGAILATAAHGKTTQGMFWMITVMRGVIGFGVGGEFPTSSAITLEAAAENERRVDETLRRRRGWVFILVVNVPLQLGGPLAMSCFLIVWEAASGESHLSTIWRVMFGIGCVWPVLVFIMRLRLVNSQLFRAGKFINYNIPWVLAVKFYWKRLLGTCGSFLLYDMIVQPNGLFSSLIIKSIVKHGDTKRTAEWQLLLGALTLPGVFIGAALCERVGRKRTMMIGFGGFLVFGVVIGAAFDHLKAIVPLFVVFYGLFQAVGHMGPGTMLGLLTTESYATGVRATFYGLSLAFGRVGGVIGTEVFAPIQKNLGQRWTFYFSAIIGAFAMVFVWLFMPDLDSRDIECEDRRFARYLQENKFRGQIGVSYDNNRSDYEGSQNARDPEEKMVEPRELAATEISDSNSFAVISPDSDAAYDVMMRIPRPPGQYSFWQRVFSLHPLDT